LGGDQWNGGEGKLKKKRIRKGGKPETVRGFEKKQHSNLTRTKRRESASAVVFGETKKRRPVPEV